MYVIKDGEVCLIDSDFSARNSLSPEWGLISRGKSNLLAILMSKTKWKQKPQNKKTKSLQRPEQFVIYFKNSAPLSPHVVPHPAGSLCYQLEGQMWLCVKHILKTYFPHLNREYTRKAGGINTSPSLSGSPALHLHSLIAAKAGRPGLIYSQQTNVSSRTGLFRVRKSASPAPCPGSLNICFLMSICQIQFVAMPVYFNQCPLKRSFNSQFWKLLC